MRVIGGVWNVLASGMRCALAMNVCVALALRVFALRVCALRCACVVERLRSLRACVVLCVSCECGRW